eukprot:2858086-Rhodomonas_salina.1
MLCRMSEREHLQSCWLSLRAHEHLHHCVKTRGYVCSALHTHLVGSAKVASLPRNVALRDHFHDLLLVHLLLIPRQTRPHHRLPPTLEVAPRLADPPADTDRLCQDAAAGDDDGAGDGDR